MTIDRSRLPDPLAFFEGEGLTLKGAGEWRTALCPFHADTSPSLRVNVRSGAFKCMSGCGAAGGDLIAWVMQRDGRDFPAACKAMGLVEGGATVPPDAKPHPLTAQQRLAVLASETNIVFVVVSDVKNKRAISDADWNRLLLALKRIQYVAVPHEET